MLALKFKDKIAATSPFLLGYYWCFFLFLITIFISVYHEGDFTSIILPLFAIGVLLTIFVGSLVMKIISSDLTKAKKILNHQSSKIVEFESAAEYRLNHDLMTGLTSRKRSKEIGEKIFANTDLTKKIVGLIFIDIVNFRMINEGLGEKFGDILLCKVAKILKDSVRTNDAVSRQYGDQFLVIIEDIDSPEKVFNCASRFMAEISKETIINGVKIFPTCGMGISIFDEDGKDFESLLMKAATASKHAKDVGGNSIRFFNETMNANMLENLNTVNGLRNALEHNELVLYYQPFHDIKSGAILGCEALIRWQHPIEGLISPIKFIPVAESSGLIIEIGEWVIREACEQLQKWKDTPLKDMTISVNLSTIQFKRGNLENIIFNALLDFDINPIMLELEITESSIISDAENFVETLSRLKKLGVKISIDDFGTGYSNLTYLQRLKIDKLKIDSSFISTIDCNDHDLTIVKAIIQMGKSLGLVVTAEGIEKEETLNILLGLECDIGQGYLYSKPKSIAHLEDFHLASVQ